MSAATELAHLALLGEAVENGGAVTVFVWDRVSICRPRA